MSIFIDEISSEIHAMIFDMDGVIWKSDTPTGDLAGFFSTLERHHIQYGFITNNGTKTIDTVQNKLATFGVACDRHFILNSAQATAYLLKERFPHGGNIYVVGEQGLIQTLANEGFSHQENPGSDTIAVIAGLDHGINYQKISTAATLIRNGVPFYGTNGDKTFPTPDGEIPGTGAILAAIAAASGVEPILAGKPEPFLLNLILSRMNIAPQHALMIGDRLETDILGGINAKCPTLLVLSGVSTRASIHTQNIHPNIVRETIFELLKEIPHEK